MANLFLDILKLFKLTKVLKKFNHLRLKPAMGYW